MPAGTTYYVCFPGHPTMVSEIGPYYCLDMAKNAGAAIHARRGVEVAVRVRARVINPTA